jgi:hypothetical protein
MLRGGYVFYAFWTLGYCDNIVPDTILSYFFASLVERELNYARNN